jgi:N-formylglutamate amidohydrolase
MVVAPAAPPGPTERNDEELVFVQTGTLPVIVSAPHGGRQPIPDVPERLGKGIPNFQTVLDANTDRLTEAFAAELEKHLDGKPWLVIARFERKALDVNRPAEHAYESEKAKPVYDAYHAALEAACRAVRKKFGRGILLDIHGQGDFPDSLCRGTLNGKTVTLLKERFGWPAVNGKRSILGQMERSGYKVRPSGGGADDAREDPKFVGGYIVGTYGSHTGHGIDAIQLEFGTELRRPDRGRLRKTARDLAEAVAVFHDEYLKDPDPE